MIVITGDYVIKPEKREEFLKAYSEFKQLGSTFNYLAEDINQPNTFRQYTEFPDEATAQLVQEKELGEYMGKIGLCLADTPRFRGLTVSNIETFME